jgi:membrane protease YdiL (CAAX protease family)
MPEHDSVPENSNPPVFRPYRRSLVANLLILTGLVLMGLFVGQLVGMVLAQLTTGLAFAQLPDVLTHPSRYPGAWSALMWLQAGSSVGGFIAAPLLFWVLFEKRRITDFAAESAPAGVVWPLVLLLVVLAFPFNGWVYELNQQLDLPPALQGVEDWMKAKEDSLDDLTKFLTAFGQPWQLVVGLLVVAAIPAVGEELLFRGVVQNLLRETFRNVHVAVWVSAALFSAIHFQFYGFLPRMLLGALFGYLYAWTRDLRVAMFAHFVNNGATLVMVYLFRQKVVDFDVENTESVPVFAALLSLAVTLGLLRLVWRSVSPVSPPRFTRT